jgi:hypothetical protein
MDKKITDTLLNTRLCDLGLELGESLFQPVIVELERELDRAGIVLRPRHYLSTGYGCNIRSVDVGLLFTDGFPALKKLAAERGMRTRSPFQMLRTLRHEAGHAFCYSNRLFATAAFRRLFGVRGRFYESYPDRWRPTAADRARVARGEIIQVYAARHADEDFATLFQTWLAAPAACLDRYRGRPRIAEKLAFVAESVRLHGRTPARPGGARLSDDVNLMKTTLGRWFAAVERRQDYNLFPKGPVA